MYRVYSQKIKTELSAVAIMHVRAEPQHWDRSNLLL